VTWTLTKADGGTHLKMVHEGFVFPGNQFAFEAISSGWGNVPNAIERVTGETEASAAAGTPAA
jgi:hypothetical protein